MVTFFCEKGPPSSLPRDSSTRRLIIAYLCETTATFQLLAKSSILEDGYLFRNMQLGIHLVLVGMLHGISLVGLVIPQFFGKNCLLVVLMNHELELS